MRVLLVLGLLAASLVGSASAQCLAACNTGMTMCLSSCPAQCPTDPLCMKTCFDQCTAEEQDCVMKCHTPAHSTLNQIKPHKSSLAAAAHKATTLTALTEAHYQSEFSSFVRRHNKVYPADEFFARYNIFKANYNFIRAHTAEKKRTYTVGVNQFADMTFEEFHAKMTGFQGKDHGVMRAANSEGPHQDIKSVASSLDWRAKGAVTPVKNQQQCGSCWAFSTTGATEGAHFIKTGKLVSLSEQQLVDCASAQGNNGCNGGSMDGGFQFVITNNGITTESNYPYVAADGTCKQNQPAAATLSSFVDVTQGDESALMAAVNVGPVSVAIEADQQVFQFYSGGVLSDPACGQQLDHGVLLVGYGTDAGQDYWIIKNSWAATWGEQGYIRIARGSNECGVASMASYPVV